MLRIIVAARRLISRAWLMSATSAESKKKARRLESWHLRKPLVASEPKLGIIIITL